MMKKFILPLFLIGLLFNNPGFSESKSVMSIGWEDLVPDTAVIQNPIEALSKEEQYALTDDEYQELMQEYESEVQQSMALAPVVEELDGKTVTLSGYGVPLDYEVETVYEMLLVPYFGACIHVPPPPSNQIVYIKMEEGTDLEQLWDAISVTGKLKTTHSSTDLADASYQIEVDEIKPYEEEMPD